MIICKLILNYLQIYFPPSKFIPSNMLNSKIPPSAVISNASLCKGETEVRLLFMKSHEEYSVVIFSVTFSGVGGRRRKSMEKYHVSIYDEKQANSWRTSLSLLDDQQSDCRLPSGAGQLPQSADDDRGGQPLQRDGSSQQLLLLPWAPQCHCDHIPPQLHLLQATVQCRHHHEVGQHQEEKQRTGEYFTLSPTWQGLHT